MKSINEKRQHYHQQIRRQQLQQIFQQKRNYFESQYLMSNLQNPIEFLKVIQKGNIKQICQCLQTNSSETMQKIQIYCQILFQIANQNIFLKEGINLMALLIINSYDKISLKIQKQNLFSKIQNALENSLNLNQQKQIQLYLRCFKKIVINRCPKFNYKTFLEKFYYQWFYYLYKIPNYIITLYQITFSHPIQLNIVFPTLLTQIIQEDCSKNLAISYAMIISNLVSLTQIQELKPYLSDLISTLKFVYCRKNIFNINSIRERAFNGIGELLVKIPSNKIEEYNILALFDHSLRSFLFSILKVDSLKIKSVVYDFFSILFGKCINESLPYNTYALKELCTDQMLIVLVNGLGYSDIDILTKVLKILTWLCTLTDEKLKLKHRLIQYLIEFNLQSLAYHKNLLVSELAGALFLQTR